MPVYQYACTECGEQLEVRQSFTDDALTVCPACEGRLRKVLSAVGVVFKGSGFYRTDSRVGASSNVAANGSSSSSESSESSTASSSSNGSNGSSESSSSGSSSNGSSSSGSSSNGSSSNGSSSSGSSSPAAAAG